MTDLQEDNKFEEFEHLEDFSDLNTENLIFEIWVKPKKVFDYILKFDPTKYVAILLVISAFIATLERLLTKNLSLDAYGFGYSVGGLAIGTLLTWLMYYVSAWFFRLFGATFLGGKANNQDFRTVIAWSNIPLIAGILTTLCIVLLYGWEAPREYYTPESEIEGYVFIAVGIVDIVLSLWSMMIMVIGVMRIQHFSIGRALANVFLPVLIIVAIIALFVIGLQPF